MVAAARADALPIPEMMSAIEIPKPGGPEALKLGKRPVPQPQAGEVLIEIHATGVNRLDVFQREGVYPIPPGASDIPGLDVAGRIAKVGAGVTGWSVGDPVCALLTGGGYAEYCTTAAETCMPIPKGLNFVEAAALPETAFTVWSNVFDRAGLKSGETLLVHGGASGIGTMAIQIAMAHGAKIFVTAGTDDRCRQCEKLGATRAVNYKSEDFVAVVKAATEGKGADVVLDMVGGDYLPRNIDVLALEGRLVQISLLGNAQSTIDYGPVMMKRLVLTGSTLRGRPPAFKGAIAAKLREHVWPLIDAGTIKPVLSKVFGLDAVADAHRYIVGGENFGKIGIQVRSN